MPAPRTRLSLAEARRVALAAQGFAEPRPERATARHLGKVLERSHLLQIDSVNVLVRAHYMPLFSRLGAYDTALLDAAAYRRRGRRLFEYWGHEASLIRLDLHPLFRWRMARAERGEGTYGGIAAFGRERRDFIAEVRRQIETRGPLSAGELENGGRGRGSWWGWSDGKRALEWLFWAGHVTTATRRGFERIYDLTERVLPPEVSGAPSVPAQEAQRALLRHAIRALGVASERCLRDYFRLDVADAKARIPELVEAGELMPVSVDGWPGEIFLDPACWVPRRIAASALLSPFDPVVWERTRTERLFGFRYRIEIYTPLEKREFGYYCLPYLLGDRIVARVDLKADRAGGRLLVHALHLEPGAERDEVLPALEAELALIAGWLKLSAVVRDAVPARRAG